MNITQGNGTTNFGPGVSIDLTGEEVALSIYSYLISHDVHVRGPATITVNGELVESANMYVDPRGHVVAAGIKHSGRGQ